MTEKEKIKHQETFKIDGQKYTLTLTMGKKSRQLHFHENDEKPAFHEGFRFQKIEDVHEVDDMIARYLKLVAQDGFTLSDREKEYNIYAEALYKLAVAAGLGVYNTPAEALIKLVVAGDLKKH